MFVHLLFNSSKKVLNREKMHLQVTLEELIIGPNISNAMRRFCYAAARHCLLIASMRNDSTKGSFITFHARGITPQVCRIVVVPATDIYALFATAGCLVMTCTMSMSVCDSG